MLGCVIPHSTSPACCPLPTLAPSGLVALLCAALFVRMRHHPLHPALRAALSLKKKWQEAREKAGKDISKPNLVMGAQGGWAPLCGAGCMGRERSLPPAWSSRISARFDFLAGKKQGRCTFATAHTPLPLLVPPILAVHVCWQKFCRYFDVEERYVPVAEGRYVSTPELMRPLIDENTIGGWVAGTGTGGHAGQLGAAPPRGARPAAPGERLISPITTSRRPTHPAWRRCWCRHCVGVWQHLQWRV